MIACCLLNLGHHTCTQSNIKRSGDGDDTNILDYAVQKKIRAIMIKIPAIMFSVHSCNQTRCIVSGRQR